MSSEIESAARALCDTFHPGVGLEQMLNDDALLYAGSATWEMWENHIPIIGVQLWAELSMETRAMLFIMAKSVSAWTKHP